MAPSVQLFHPNFFNVSLQQQLVYPTWLATAATAAAYELAEHALHPYGNNSGYENQGNNQEGSWLMDYNFEPKIPNDTVVSFTSGVFTLTFDQLYGLAPFSAYTNNTTDDIPVQDGPYDTNLIANYGDKVIGYYTATFYSQSQFYCGLFENGGDWELVAAPSSVARNRFGSRIMGCHFPCGIDVSNMIRYSMPDGSKTITYKDFSSYPSAPLDTIPEPDRLNHIIYDGTNEEYTKRYHFAQTTSDPDSDTSAHRTKLFTGSDEYSFPQGSLSSYGNIINEPSISATMGFYWFTKPWWEMDRDISALARGKANLRVGREGTNYYEDEYITVRNPSDNKTIGAIVHTDFTATDDDDDDRDNYCTIDNAGYLAAFKKFIYDDDWGIVNDKDYSGGVVYGYKWQLVPKWSGDIQLGVPDPSDFQLVFFDRNYTESDTTRDEVINNPNDAMDCICYKPGTYGLDPTTITDDNYFNEGWLSGKNYRDPSQPQVWSATISTFDTLTSYRITIDGNLFSQTGTTNEQTTIDALVSTLSASVIPAVAAIVWTRESSGASSKLQGRALTSGIPFTFTLDVSGGTGAWSAISVDLISYGISDW